MPDKNCGKANPEGPVCDTGPGSHDFIADIIKHVAADDQQPEQGAQHDACDPLVRMGPALGDMRDEHPTDAKQDRDQDKSVEFHHPRFERVHFGSELPFV